MGPSSTGHGELSPRTAAIQPRAIAGSGQLSPSALPVLEQPKPVRRVIPPPPTPGRTLRWCRVFPAQYVHLGQVNDFVSDLIESRLDRGKIIARTSELTVAAIEQATTSGEDFFVVEVGWSGRTVRISAVAVAASGAIAGPVLSVCFNPAATAGQRSTDAVLRDSVREQEAELADCFPGWFIWFGEYTGEWWAMPRKAVHPDQLISAPTAETMARILRVPPSRPTLAVRPAPWGASVASSR